MHDRNAHATSRLPSTGIVPIRVFLSHLPKWKPLSHVSPLSHAVSPALSPALSHAVST